MRRGRVCEKREGVREEVGCARRVRVCEKREGLVRRGRVW